MYNYILQSPANILISIICISNRTSWMVKSGAVQRPEWSISSTAGTSAAALSKVCIYCSWNMNSCHSCNAFLRSEPGKKSHLGSICNAPFSLAISLKHKAKEGLVMWKLLAACWVQRRYMILQEHLHRMCTRCIPKIFQTLSLTLCSTAKKRCAGRWGSQQWQSSIFVWLQQHLVEFSSPSHPQDYFP